jgi:hypothetical protein
VFTTVSVRHSDLTGAAGGCVTVHGHLPRRLVDSLDIPVLPETAQNPTHSAVGGREVRRVVTLGELCLKTARVHRPEKPAAVSATACAISLYVRTTPSRSTWSSHISPSASLTPQQHVQPLVVESVRLFEVAVVVDRVGADNFEPITGGVFGFQRRDHSKAAVADSWSALVDSRLTAASLVMLSVSMEPPYVFTSRVVCTNRKPWQRNQTRRSASPCGSRRRISVLTTCSHSSVRLSADIDEGAVSAADVGRPCRGNESAPDYFVNSVNNRIWERDKSE